MIRLDESLSLFGIMGNQRGRKIVVGIIRAIDLIRFHEIDQWKPGKKIEEQGCQRPPVKTHFHKIGRKLKNNSNATLPTSITLSANENVNKGENRNSIKVTVINEEIGLVRIDIPEDHLLKIVDGQHRVLGLDYAIHDLMKNNRIGKIELENFQLPFAIIFVNDRVDEINLFYEINSTAKKVPTDLALQLLNEMSNNSDIRLSKSERWKLVALNVAMELNKNPDSVWHQNISEGQRNHEIASSTSFVSSLAPLLQIEDIKKMWEETDDYQKIGKELAPLVNNFWEALKELMPKAFPPSDSEKEKWVIQKTPGFYIWHMVAAHIFNDCLKKREQTMRWNKNNIKDFLEKYGSMGVKDYESYWNAHNRENKIGGGRASTANSQGAFKQLAEEIKDEIDESYSLNYKEGLSFV